MLKLHIILSPFPVILHFCQDNSNFAQASISCMLARLTTLIKNEYGSLYYVKNIGTFQNNLNTLRGCQNIYLPTIFRSTWMHSLKVPTTQELGCRNLAFYRGCVDKNGMSHFFQPVYIFVGLKCKQKSKYLPTSKNKWL